MVIWTLAKKDLRLLLRDARALIILLAMPLIFILVLGVSLGEGFGQKPEDRLRVSVLNLDEGLPRFFDRPAIIHENVAWLAAVPNLQGSAPLLGACGFATAGHGQWFPHDSWSALVLKDLAETADLHVEMIPNREEAERLVRTGRRAAVLVLGPHFSKRVQRCSFLATGWQKTFFFAAGFPQSGEPVQLALNGFFQESQGMVPLYMLDGINPFYRDGIRFGTLEVEVLRDETQQTAAAIIDQVAQGCLLRIVLPWMIGRAFEKIGDPEFLTLLGREEQLPTPVKLFLASPIIPMAQKRTLGSGLQSALQNLFPRYHLTAKTWASLTKEAEHAGDGSEKLRAFQEEGKGWLKRGAMRYQLLVPSYLVMFAFFLVLTVGWLFVAERRQGTMKRLCAAPLARWQIVLGKLLPCLLVSLFQGFFILLAGRVIFGMSWGPAPLWLVAVVTSTSLAAMGLALLVASVARTETQVAIYGTLLVLVLAGLSGGLFGDREFMSEQMKRVSLVTPHAWALDAYRQLLANPGGVQVDRVAEACGVLVMFGVGFVGMAWWMLRLD
jgi:ABC-type transport system involved in cytochrome c biogenesis permease component